MKKTTILLFACLLVSGTALAKKTKTSVAAPVPVPAVGLSLREIRYDGKLSDNEARFAVAMDVEFAGPDETSVKLFEGDVALLPVKLPESLKIVRDGNCYFLTTARPGRFQCKLELVAKIQRAEPWNQISFAGPPAAIASVTAQAAGTNREVQLLAGTLLESVQTDGVSRVKGFLGADQTVTLRWSCVGGMTQVARQALLTVDTTASAQITSTVIKYTTRFHYEIIQGSASRLRLSLPAQQALTRLDGEQIRDWQIKPDGDRQLLTIEFIKPVEKECQLALFSEQTVEAIPPDGVAVQLNPPQPLNVERESGAFTLATEDTLVEIGSLTGLRRVNAAEGALATYRFSGRPFGLALTLKRIEPVINVADRVTARLEETRLRVSHHLALNVEKAGVFALELLPPPGFLVADVQGNGIEEWQVVSNKLRVNFSARVLGTQVLDVQLEQALKTFPDQIAVEPLHITNAVRETAQIGAASSPGIRLKTAELSGLREIPVNRLPEHADELLAFSTEQPDWKLSLAAERQAARVVADVFNLITIGDGIVGGSATIRYGLANQGVQEFKVKLPAYCKNIEFTGPNIRRKEQAGEVWTIGLQDKVWGGYTLVVTYNSQFDPRSATLPLAGIHALEVEHETGSIAITTAASLKLNPKAGGESLHRVDETELAVADRALITRPVLLAWQYTGDQYDLSLDVQRYEELPVLEAVADRTEIVSVLTETGEMLTQASFMVKNSEKQFQKFQLPEGANLWGCYVNGQPAKPERDGDGVLVPLPRGQNRDEAFAVDIVYAQTNAPLGTTWSRTLQFSAPRTDIPNTYAEWQLYVPLSQRLSGFGGSMTVAQGTTYGWFDAWREFLAFYGQVLSEAGAGLWVISGLALLLLVLVVSAVRRGWSGVITVAVVVAIVAVLAAMLLPSLATAKRKAVSVSTLSDLKQIGVAALMFADDNNGRLPVSYEEMTNYLRGDAVTVDPTTGERFTYLGGGLQVHDLKTDSVLAYSPMNKDRCAAVFADGHSEMMSAGRFAELSQRGLVRSLLPEELGLRRQADAISRSQFSAGGGGARGGSYAGNLPVAAPAPASVESLTTGTTTGGLSPDRGSRIVSPGAPLPEQPPTAAGIRSIRIEIPRTGQPFVFTKVLNVGNSPLSIRTKIMALKTFQRLQTAEQALVFLLGLSVGCWQWRLGRPNSFILTLALVLMIGSMGSLLIAWRALHSVLIIGLPVILLAGIAWLVWKYWPRRSESLDETAGPGLVEPSGGLPPVVAVIAFGLLLGTHPSSATPSSNESSAIANVSIVSASYTGTVNDRVAQLEATLQLSSARPDQIVPLFGDEVVVQQFTVKSGDAKLIRNGNGIAVQLGRRGAATLQIKMLVKPGGDVTRRRLAFGIPPALSSRFAFLLDQPDADVDFPTAISFQRSADRAQTRVEAVVGPGDRVELLWTPRVKRAAEVAAAVFCQNTTLAMVGGGVVNVQSVLDYQVTQGELRRISVQLPSGQRLLRVEGDAIRTWETRPENGGQLLLVELLKGISPAYRLTVETESALNGLPATVKIETPHAVDVKRETGLVALGSGEELNLTVDPAKALQRVDAAEFARPGAPKADGLVSAFRFLNPDFDLRVRAEAVQPQVEAVVHNHIHVGTEQAGLSAVINYTIKRTGVFALKVALPAGYRVAQVSGDNIQQYAEHGESGARVLEVTLKERTIGAYTLRLELVKNFKELPKSFAVEGVHPLGTVKLAGFIAVAADPGVAVKTGEFDGLTEIPATALPDASLPSGNGTEAGGVLAYKFIAGEPGLLPGWRLVVTTEAVEPWLRAEIVNTITLTEAMNNGRAQVRYEIQNAPVKSLCVRVPASFKNVDISGPNIRSREQKVGVWCVELQDPTCGSYTLNAST